MDLKKSISIVIPNYNGRNLIKEYLPFAKEVIENAGAIYEIIIVDNCSILLNSDVKLTPGYFEHQWKYFSLPDTFGVMGRIIDMEGDGIQDAARMPKFNGLKLKTGYFYCSDNADDRLYTMYLSGANALIDAAKLKEIGGFDEIFSPFYSEDMELSIRAWRNFVLKYVRKVKQYSQDYLPQSSVH
ncbi:glycosyltransferase family 2 protein [Mucilaginibacter sp. McL0603]|uniref:glycosyltransferase family 2 protein n=1 Tax=Mucilaginibacter sp. McL0603 TaxID=3415670 RepID=UPI003CF49982